MKWAVVKFDENSCKLKILRKYNSIFKGKPKSYCLEEYNGRNLHKKFILKRKITRSYFKDKDFIILKANTVDELKTKIEQLILLKEII